MPTNSTIPAVRNQLVALLKARPALSGLQIEAHWPVQIEDESVHCGEVRASSTIPVMTAGRKRREEDYELDVWIVAGAPGQIAAQAEARAQALFVELEDIVANDPSLGGAAGSTLRVTLDSYEWRTGPDDEGYGSTIKAVLGCKARLT